MVYITWMIFVMYSEQISGNFQFEVDDLARKVKETEAFPNFKQGHFVGVFATFGERAILVECWEYIENSAKHFCLCYTTNIGEERQDKSVNSVNW